MFLINRYIILNSLLVVIILLLIANSTIFNSFNNNIYDLFLTLNKSDKPQNEVVIVKIDDKTIEGLGLWPFNREIHTQLLNKLFDHGAKVAGFYVDFTIPSNSKTDKDLISTLEKYPIVTLNPFTFTSSDSTTQFWKIIKKKTHLGHDILRTDKDGVVRNHSPLLNKTNSFSLTILKLIDKNKFSYDERDDSLNFNGQKIEKANNNKIPINFKHPYYSFKDYSYYDVLQNNFSEDAFKNKIVLIGMTKRGLTDYYTTPFSKKFIYSGKTAPIYIQAQIIDSLLNFKVLKKVDDIYLYLISIISIPFLIAFIKHFNIIRQLFLLGLLSPISMLIISFGLFSEFNVWLSPSLFIIMNYVTLIILVIGLNINVSSFLDNYINELTSKTDKKKSLNVDQTIDNKLITLKEVTNIIEKDRVILDTVLSSVKSVIILFDTEQNIIYSNIDEDKTIYKQLMKEINFSEIFIELEKHTIYKKGINIKKRNYEFIVNKAKDNLFTGVFNDITEITKINEAKTIIIRMLSHEMKTPLTTILLCCDSLFAANKDNTLNNYINKIADQTEFVKELITNFLELNKLEITEFEVNKEYIDIDKLIRSVIDGFSLIRETKNIKINYNVRSKKDQNMLGDNNYLFILFKNLIDNALKYSQPDTTIDITLTYLDNTVEVSVKDQGFGIHQEDIEKLFQKFYRVKNDKTENIPGTGLGLSFVKQIIELHNGDIVVTSTVNVGSEFIVTLPYNLKH